MQRESDARRGRHVGLFPLRGGVATPSRDSTHGRPLFFRSFNPPPLLWIVFAERERKMARMTRGTNAFCPSNGAFNRRLSPFLRQPSRVHLPFIFSSSSCFLGERELVSRCTIVFMFSRNSRPILRAVNESKRAYVAVINFDRLIKLENGFVRIKFRI